MVVVGGTFKTINETPKMIRFDFRIFITIKRENNERRLFSSIVVVVGGTLKR